VRRLPVIQQADTEDAAAASRPRWQWCLIGAGLVSTIWVPLAVMAAPLGTSLAAHLLRVAPADVAAGRVTLAPQETAILASLSALPLIVCFGVAAAAGGALVGRFGGQAGKREAGISGVIAAFAVTLLAAIGGVGLSPAGLAAVSVVLAAAGAAAGFAGGGFGASRRPVLGSRR
jgi:tRNA-(ms[2]io[6]A)-hydroxylase